MNGAIYSKNNYSSKPKRNPTPINNSDTANRLNAQPSSNKSIPTSPLENQKNNSSVSINSVTNTNSSDKPLPINEDKNTQNSGYTPKQENDLTNNNISPKNTTKEAKNEQFLHNPKKIKTF